ncbi:MAG: tryptophan synthase subunit alpha [Bacillota bacterium]
MTRIASTFAGKKDKALIAFITVGYPTLEATLEAVPLLERCGVDMVELGIPFSDPLADGITIRQASFQALQNGITPAACLDAARLIRRKSNLPLLFMTYYNPVLTCGPELFCAEAARAGIDGMIIPDLPLEEAGIFETSACAHNLDLIYLLAPNSSEERIRLTAQRARGFIYLVSVTGLTGMRQELPPGLDEFVARVGRLTGKPLCVGFGISAPEQAAKLSASVDGVIVGSSIVHLMGSLQDWQPAVAEYVSSLKKAIMPG